MFDEHGEDLYFALNWAALFLSVFWAAYRKMYVVAAVLGAYYILSLFLGEYLGWNVRVLDGMVGIFIGLSGTSLYHKHIRRKLHTLTRHFPPEYPELPALSEAEGGVSVGHWG